MERGEAGPVIADRLGEDAAAGEGDWSRG